MGRHVATCDCVKCFKTRMKNGKLRFSDVILAAKEEGLNISVEFKEVCGEEVKYNPPKMEDYLL